MTALGPAVPPVLHRLAAARVSLRELEVIDASAEGLSYFEVGDLLGLSEATVKAHLTRLGHKARVGTRAGIVGWAYRNGLLVRVPLPVVPLTPSQRAVVPLVARGLEDGEIGRELDIAMNTAKHHVHCAARLLNARTRAHMVRRGIDCGVLPLVPRLVGEEARVAS